MTVCDKMSRITQQDEFFNENFNKLERIKASLAHQIFSFINILLNEKTQISFWGVINLFEEFKDQNKLIYINGFIKKLEGLIN
jgi:hypothetical protein